MVEQRFTRRLAAVLAADVVGYSRLMGLDEEGTLAALKAHHAELIDPTITEHGGRIVKLTGDGALVEFPSVIEAVKCAVEIQRDMGERNAAVPEERQIVFRIGINLGDLIIEDGDIFGDGVNVAARLQELAHPGGVCLSGDAYRQVQGRIDAYFHDLGERTVKNIANPVRAFCVDMNPLSDSSAAVQAAAASRPWKPAVAVLAFANMSGDVEQDYFADGITEDIITELSRFRSLCVIARNSSFVYKNRPASVRDIGRDLGVQYILEGSVRRAGGRVRVTAQLIEVSTGNHLWAERYDRDLEDIFAVQDEITRAIVANLPTHVEEAERRRTLHVSTGSLSAYDHWLRGKHFLYRGSKDDILQARRHFEKAIDLDPNFAPAYVDLGESYYVEHHSTWTTSREAASERAFELARKAVQLDPRDSRAHLALAWAYLNVKGDFDLARTQCDEALALNPNDYYNYCFGGWLSACSGDLEHAAACSNEALRRSPLVPDGCLNTRVVAEYLAGKYKESIMAFGRMLRPSPDIFGWLAAAYAQLGRAEEARAMADEFRQRVRSLPWAPPDEDADRWRQYWAKEFRSKDPAAREHLHDGLRKAGLPI